MKLLVCLVGLVALVQGQGENNITGPITEHFQSWLNAHGYESDDFVRADLGGCSYGGKKSASEKITKKPVVFIHGNSDAAIHHNPGLMSIATGWDNSINYFLSKGYKTSELYATTWGDANEMNAETRTHDCATLVRLRHFLEAIIAYTEAKQIDIISHSMGVTLARKLIQGGTPAGGSCNLGKPLNAKIDTFVGISGANYGLCTCQYDEFFAATCNGINGFFPGGNCGFNSLCGESSACTGAQYSTYMTDLNSNPLKIASYVFSAWSYNDDLILYNDLVWGNPTSLIPNSTDHKMYYLLTHMQTKELTAADQYHMVVYHTIPSSS